MGTQDKSPLSASDVGALHELAIRLVQWHYSENGPSPPPAQLWPARLPGDLLFELPVPEDCRLIGSFGRGLRYTILADTYLSPSNLVALYQERMLASGWTAPARGFHMGGFVMHSVTDQSQALFCGSDDGPAVIVSAETNGDGVTHVTITVNLDPDNSFCRQTPEPDPLTFRTGPHLPALEAPPDSDLDGSTASSGRDTSTALATLTCALDLEDVDLHYRTQLHVAGWRLDEFGTGGPVAWSTWTLPDLDGGVARALLSIVRDPGEEHHTLYLHARSATEAGIGDVKRGQ